MQRNRVNYYLLIGGPGYACTRGPSIAYLDAEASDLTGPSSLSEAEGEELPDVIEDIALESAEFLRISTAVRVRVGLQRARLNLIGTRFG